MGARREHRVLDIADVAAVVAALRADMRRACRLLLQARGVLPGRAVSIPSEVQVVTPYNEPAWIYDGPVV